MPAIVEMQLPLDTVAANCRLLPGTGAVPVLVVLLHGAVNREKRSVPFFNSFLPGIPALWQLSVADPAMEHFDNLAACWYLGWKEERLWESLGRAIRAKAAGIGAERVFYVGGSSGGFAALLLSHQHPGSIALLRNPQVDLGRHVYKTATDKYFCEAWDGEPERYGVPIDLTRLYADGMPNRVIYLQSPGDRKHLHVQTAAFLAAISPRDQARVVFDCRYHGIVGHGGSVPQPAAMGWLAAALAVPDNVRDWSTEMQGQYFASNQRDRVSFVSKVASQNLAARDFALADRIVRYQLEA